MQVDVFVNGRLLGRYQVADGSIGEVPVPRRLLEREGRLNCVAFVAYGQSGAIVARNYCLFHAAQTVGRSFSSAETLLHHEKGNEDDDEVGVGGCS